MRKEGLIEHYESKEKSVRISELQARLPLSPEAARAWGGWLR